MGFFKELWKNQPNTVMGFGALLILIGFFNAVQQGTPPTVKNQSREDRVAEYNQQPDVKYMKACARQLRIDRVNWYLDEKGITDNFERLEVLETTNLFDSDKPYQLMESYKRLGIPPKTGRNLPFVNCVPSLKDQVPEEFLRRMGY